MILKSKMKLLRPFTGTGAIFFPIGLPLVGTCQFASEECQKYCYAHSDSLFDYEAKIPNKEKWEIYDYIVTKPIDRIREKIIFDLDGLQTPILHWFGTGDCESIHVDKISAIISSLPDHVIQMGFTRNKILWEKHKEVFAFTIESVDSAGEENGMFSIPNYKEEISVMYSTKYQVRGGFCGPLTCKDFIESKLEHFVDCKVCHKFKLGCFDRRKAG